MELSPILAELERFWDVLAAEWSDMLPKPSRRTTQAERDAGMDNYVRFTPEKPVLNLASKGRKRTQVSWYTDAVWNDAQEDTLAALAGVNTADRQLVKRAEVTLATELLTDPYRTADELARMVVMHYTNQAHATGDDGMYYPRAWVNRARHFKHYAEVDPEQPHRGWSLWYPEDAALWREFVGKYLNLSVFEVSRDGVNATERKGSRMKKWRCGCTTVRCATRLVGHCDLCGETFAWAEANEPAPYGYEGYVDDTPAPSPSASSVSNVTTTSGRKV